MEGPKILYSPLGLEKMRQYQAQKQKLVHAGHLTIREAEILIVAEMQRIIAARSD